MSGYPWDAIAAMTTNLKIYLFLPSYVEPPDSYLLVGKLACKPGQNRTGNHALIDSRATPRIWLKEQQPQNLCWFN